MKKIGFISSSGGHFEQLMMLKPLMKKYDSFVVTEKTGYMAENGDIKQYYLIQVNRREFLCIFKIVVNTLKSLNIFLREKPDIIVSTGVLATIPMCIMTKIFKKKLIYIESFAKVNTPTLTGKLLYKYADQFYVQWKELKEFYPKAIYMGGIY